MNLVRNTINWTAVRQQLERRRLRVQTAAAEYYAEQMRIEAPKDTGYLVSTIHVDAASNPETTYVICACPYAGWVARGHHTLRDEQGRFTHVTQANVHMATWVPPNPFDIRALDKTKAAFPAIARKAWSTGDRSQPGTNRVDYVGASFG